MGDSKPPRLEIVSPEECFALLGRAPVGAGRVEYSGLVGGATGELRDPGAVGGVPDGAGTKLDAALSHAIAAFEADGYERDGSSGWCVWCKAKPICSPTRGRWPKSRRKGCGRGPWTVGRIALWPSRSP